MNVANVVGGQGCSNEDLNTCQFKGALQHCTVEKHTKFGTTLLHRRKHLTVSQQTVLILNSEALVAAIALTK
jgi:hypothetical protein